MRPANDNRPPSCLKCVIQFERCAADIRKPCAERLLSGYVGYENVTVQFRGLKFPPVQCPIAEFLIISHLEYGCAPKCRDKRTKKEQYFEVWNERDYQ